MPRDMRPTKLYGGYLGPNPLKASFILSELDIFEYEVINPNSRLPAIHDPNTGITIWESGAILEYILDTYDKEHKLSFAPGTKEFTAKLSGSSGTMQSGWTVRYSAM